VLNKRTRSVFRELLDSLRKALQDMDMQRAAEVRKAALQVSRLCDDPQLNVEFDSLQEFYEHIFGDQVRALELSRKVFVKSLAASDVTMDKDHAALAINLVASLHRADRCREARRICRATLALYEDVGAEWGRYKQLQALHSILNIELGNMREGLRDLHDTYPALPEQLKRGFSGKLVESMLLSGLTPIHHAHAIGEDSTAKAVALVRVAALMDEQDQLRALVKRYSGDDRIGLPEGSIWETYARGLSTGNKAALADFEKAVDAERGRIAVRPTQEFAYAACSAHLARAAGNEPKARKLHDDAQALLNSLDPEVNPQMLALALHNRNALALYPADSKAKDAKQHRSEATAFFEMHHAQGYGAFSRLM
jgi:hypothetical protein